MGNSDSMTRGLNTLKKDAIKGDSPSAMGRLFRNSFDMSHIPCEWNANWVVPAIQVCGSQSPIANKYREGNVKRTLERELKEPQIAK